MEMPIEEAGSVDSLQGRPGVLFIGCPSVGKRTLLSRLLSIDIPDTSNLSSEVLCQGWTLETKYYSVELSIWMAHLDDGISFQELLASKKLVALVMVFDMIHEPSFLTLKNWVAGIDLGKFEIVLCIGNKADLVPGLYAHVEYRRFLQKSGASSGDSNPEVWDYGINEIESCSLLGNQEPSINMKKLCMEWCIEHNIEYIEACASNADFDKCLSVDGDIQGVERLYGALSAHMWPGMILKSGDRITFPGLVKKEDLTDEESDYEFGYEVLSGDPDEVGAEIEGTSICQTENQDVVSCDEGTVDNPVHDFASEASISRDHTQVEETPRNEKHNEVTKQEREPRSQDQELSNVVDEDDSLF
ncbi:hypothetical protein HPP92_007026 [Vanilla planifolia]|uniref:Uncharacterized protein n=1 Tax=Vanilla planifolia TaxID=51239 RepID=A0A835VA97_VANPL|nr:hypothetical protein HPP92_007026 [Vanilla planifolia]